MESVRAAAPGSARGDGARTAEETVMREIVIDTETTGLDPNDGHRIVEIACIELVHHVPTGRKFHRYVNPGARHAGGSARGAWASPRSSSPSQPPFAAIADELLAFIGGDRLVIHNAEFDLAFHQCRTGAARPRGRSACPFVDTLGVGARAVSGRAGQPRRLCRRFAIDLAVREKHGAEIDCGLLAEVYIELLGGRQPGLDFAVPPAAMGCRSSCRSDRPRRAPRPHAASLDELAAHQAMLATLKTPLWLAA